MPDGVRSKFDDTSCAKSLVETFSDSNALIKIEVGSATPMA